MEDIKDVEMQFIKLEPKMLQDPKILIIDSMKENNMIFYVWINLLLLAGKSNMGGLLCLNSSIPYTCKTLAIVFRRSVNDVKKALNVLVKLEMIEVTEEGIFKIKNWNKHQSIIDIGEKVRKQTSERVARYRERKKLEKKIETQKDDSIEEAEISCKSLNEEDITKAEDFNKSTCNVTDNNFNVTVALTNNKDINKKNKNIEKKNKNIEKENNENCNLQSDVIELTSYSEEITGKVGIFDIGALNLAIREHGKEYVKLAIDKAIKCGKPNMAYVNGILKNWRKEGYPEDEISCECSNNIITHGKEKNNGIEDVGEKSCGKRSIGKGSGNGPGEFEGIKGKEWEKLNDDKRREYERKVI